jgi:hypothetical protein
MLGGAKGTISVPGKGRYCRRKQISNKSLLT